MFERFTNKPNPAKTPEDKPAAKAHARVRSSWEPIVAGFFAYGAILLALVYTFTASVLFYSNFKVEGHGAFVYIVGGIAVAMGDAAFLTIIIRNLARKKMMAAFVSSLLWIAVMIASMVAEAGLFAAVIDKKDAPAAAAEAKYTPARDKLDRLTRELVTLEKRADLRAPAEHQAELEAYLSQPAVNEQGDEIRASVRQVTRWPEGCAKPGFYARTYCPDALAKSSKLASANRLDALRGGVNLDGSPRVGLVEKAEKELEALGPEPTASVPLFRLMAKATGDSEAKWTLIMIFTLAGAVHMILTFGVWVANEALLEDPEAKAARLATLAAIKAESEAAISRAEHEAELAKLTDDLNAELDRLRLEHNAERAKAVEEARADLEAQIIALKAENERQAQEAVRLAEEALKRASDVPAEPARPNFEKGLPPETLDDPVPDLPPLVIAAAPTPTTPAEPLIEDPNNGPNDPTTETGEPVLDDPRREDTPPAIDDLAGANNPGAGAGDDVNSSTGPDAGDPADQSKPAATSEPEPAPENKPLGDSGGDSDLDDRGDGARATPGGVDGGDSGDLGIPPEPAETKSPPTAAIEDPIPAPSINLSKMTKDVEENIPDEVLLR